MHRQRTARSPLLVALVAIGVLAAVVPAPDASGNTVVGSGGSVTGATPATFVIAGNVGALFPGKTRPLVLTITNPEKVAIKVTTITTTVGNASIHCGAKYVTVTPFAGLLVVRARKSAEATVRVKLLHSAPDACQGAQFPLAYQGLATAK